MKTIEVSDEVAEWLESWVEDGPFDTNDAVVRDAVSRLSITQEYKTEKLDSMFHIFDSAESWVDTILSYDRSMKADVAKELDRIRRLRLGERVSQMEELDRSVKAHMEVLASGMVRLNRPWWEKIFG